MFQNNYDVSGKPKTSAKNYQYLSATGALPYNMTNDYMFRIVLQRDEETLTGLICSILHLERIMIKSIVIENPVDPGESVDDKEYQMDILVTLNNDTCINLEMQVLNEGNWPVRSLVYLCRRFDNLSHGTEYSDTKPVYHIGFIDFPLFKDEPEFFAKYQLINAKTGRLYTDKFNLLVVELKSTDLATEEDRSYHIDTWAKLFKATTWEEIKMITKDNPSMNSTAESLYMANSDFVTREKCRIREDAIFHENYMQNKIKELTKENSSLTSEIDHLKSLLAEHGITDI